MLSFLDFFENNNIFFKHFLHQNHACILNISCVELFPEIFRWLIRNKEENRLLFVV
jgi:hypothetical protein